MTIFDAKHGPIKIIWRMHYIIPNSIELIYVGLTNRAWIQRVRDTHVPKIHRLTANALEILF